MAIDVDEHLDRPLDTKARPSLAERMLFTARAQGLTVEQYLARQRIDDVDAEDLQYDWRGFCARPTYRKLDGRFRNEWGGQLPPPSHWLTWLLMTGRGFGKTRTCAEYVHERAMSEPGLRICILGQDPGDVFRVMLRGESGLLSISHPSERPVYTSSTRTLTWPNGTMGEVYSGHNIEEMRGPQFSLVWIDELMAFQKPSEAWDLAFNANRLVSPNGQPPRTVVSTTPRPGKLLRKILGLSGTAITTGSTFDNKLNLASSYLGALEEMFAGTRYGEQELKGALLDDVEGALWSEALIASRRLNDYPDLERIVVAMDPNASLDGAEAGIIVSGRDAHGKGYVLEDASGQFSPERWASMAVAAYRRWDADSIVAEANNGGEMIRSLIHGVDATAHVRLVHARTDKINRARPVSQLTERGRIFFVGTFVDLESQLTTFTGKEKKEKSPDRLDAFVWSMHDLFSEEINAVAASFV